MKKRKKIKNLLIAVLAILIVLSFSSCEAFILYLAEELLLTDISGGVVNARSTTSDTDWFTSSSDTLVDATIYAYPESGTGFAASTDYQGTVESDGSWYIYDLAPGRYKITGEKTGWTFVPRYVDVDGDDMVIPDIIAYEDDPDAVVILVSWENRDIDVDGYLSYFNGTDRSSVGPTTDASYSSHILLDREITGTYLETDPLVVTISIHDIETFPDKGSPTDEIPIDPDFAPDHQMRYYVEIADGSAETLSLTGYEGYAEAAFAQVDIMYNSEHYGSWELPYNTAENILHVLTVEAIDHTIDGNADTTADYFWIYSAGNANYGIRGLDYNVAIPVSEIK